MTQHDERPKNAIRRALSLSFLQTIVNGVVGFAAVVIVSHLLTPAQVGVFSVAAGMVALVQMLRDFGVTEFLIQEQHVDDAKIRTVFTINLIIAWLLGLALFACSGVLGRFYGHPGVTQVLELLSGMFILLPFGAITQTLLKRDLEFGKLTKIQLGQNLVGSCVVVALAFAGFSYMSMAWAALVSVIVMVAGCAVWGRQYRVRGVGLRDWKQVLAFGMNRTVADVAAQLGEQSGNLIIGRVLGMTDTGLYSRGYGVVNMYRTNVVSAIGAVAFPAFAREHRESGKAPVLFLKSLVCVTGVSWPFFAAGILLAFPLIRVLFGPQWDAAVPLMRWLCAAALVQVPTYQCAQLLIAMGRVRTVTRLQLWYQPIRVALTLGAAFEGIVAVAAVQILVYLVAVFLYYRKIRVYDGLSLRQCAHAVVPSVAAVLATCLVPAVVVAWPGFVQGHMVLALVAAIAGGCVGWLVCVRMLRHPLLDELRRVLCRFPVVCHAICG